jgi:hypothetical protein
VGEEDGPGGVCVALAITSQPNQEYIERLLWEGQALRGVFSAGEGKLLK